MEHKCGKLSRVSALDRFNRVFSIDDRRFLQMILNHIGKELADMILSLPIDMFPLLICLMSEQGKIKVANVIDPGEQRTGKKTSLFSSHDGKTGLVFFSKSPPSGLV